MSHHPSTEPKRDKRTGRPYVIKAGSCARRLARISQIRKVPGAVCLRRKGHGTAGGIVWEAA